MLTREDAIQMLEEINNSQMPDIGLKYTTALEMAIDALKLYPVLCKDCIHSTDKFDLDEDEAYDPEYELFCCHLETQVKCNAYCSVGRAK